MEPVPIPPVEDVAIRARSSTRLMYRDRYGGPESLFDDLDSYPDGLSLLGLVGSQMLIEPDWDVIGLMDKLDSPCSFAHGVSAVDPLRTEAMLHAWPNDPRDELANADWAEPYLARWPAVEAVMDELAPTTWTHEAMEDVANAAGASGDGRGSSQSLARPVTPSALD